jgi:anti-anti-sigma factor
MSTDTQPQPLNRQTLTSASFVEIIDTLVNDFDIIDVLTHLTARCVELIHVAAAGILLADENGHLRVVGASSEQIQLLELFQLQNEQGPCLDCYNTGAAVAAPDLTTASAWPQFAAESIRAGYPSVYAIPLRLNGVTLGCLNLFMSDPGAIMRTDIAIAQALADLASIAIVQSHANSQNESRGHLHLALDSRIAIEQAKGMIAEHHAVDAHDAFEMLRSHARDHHRGLTATANELVVGIISVDDLNPAPLASGAGEFTAKISIKGQRRVVRLAGELDLATRVACFNACVTGDTNTVEIDLSALTFLDCSGYGALVAARLVLEERGGSLTVSNSTGQPDHLVRLLAQLETTNKAHQVSEDHESEQEPVAEPLSGIEEPVDVGHSPPHDGRHRSTAIPKPT